MLYTTFEAMQLAFLTYNSIPNPSNFDGKDVQVERKRHIPNPRRVYSTDVLYSNVSMNYDYCTSLVILLFIMKSIYKFS